MKNTALCLAALCTPVFAQAAVDAVDLGNYQHTATYSLPAGPAAEASAITWNWNSDSLFVLGDEGDALVEVSKTGTLIGAMSLVGFDDTEGLTYIGNGRFVLVEERLQDAYVLTYAAGGSVSRSSLSSVSLGPTVGNVGLEGISYDPLSGNYIVVKEKSPQDISEATLDFTNGAATLSSVFDPVALGLLDLSDVQVLSTVAAPGSPDAANLLIYSQESARLLEVDRNGTVLSMFDFGALSSSAEGVTIDANGTIYVVDEGPNLYVLTPAPVPLPAAAWLLLSGLAGLGTVGVRRRHGGAGTVPA